MKKLFSIMLMLAMLLSFTSAFAEAAGSEYDITVDTTNIDELGVPTYNKVNELKSKANTLWDAENYAEAAAAYNEYARHANWLANLISAKTEPYYNGNSDERSNLYRSNKDIFNIAADAEKRANSYKEQRNTAMTREALCYYKIGDYNAAVPLLVKTLELLEIDQTDLWQQCADALSDILGV